MNPTLTNRWHPLRVLYRVFLLRVIDLELLSADGDPSRLMGQFAAVFVTISFFCSFPVPIFLVGRTAIPHPLAYMFEHFLIETSMTIAGIIAVLGWDSAFPDRRDMLVLGPLPVRSSTLFTAKIAALFAGPLLAAASFNLFTGFSWPLVFAVGVGSSFSLLRTLPVYWLTIALAAAFPVLCLLAIQGLAANLLPRQIFLRLSAFLQAGLLCLLMTNYFLGPSFNSPAALLAPANQHTLHLLPGYWFLGLFNQLNGSLQPELVPLAHRAWAALGIAAAGAVAALLLSYLRMLPRIVEQPEIVPAMRSRSLPLGNSLASVVTLFSLRTLTRSRLHRMILSVYLGIGLTIIFGFLHTRFANTGLRFAEGHTQPLPLSLTYLLSSILTIALTALALRIVVGIPITLRANWIFRATQVRPAWRYHHATRLSFFTLATAPAVLLLLGAGLLRGRGTILAVAEHLAIMALFGALLVELCLFTFRKIAFACSYLPGKANLHFAFWIALFASIEWIRDAAGYEGRTLTHPSNTTLLLLGLAAAATLIHALSNQHSRRTADLLFEEEDLTAMVTLNLR